MWRNRHVWKVGFCEKWWNRVEDWQNTGFWKGWIGGNLVDLMKMAICEKWVCCEIGKCVFGNFVKNGSFTSLGLDTVFFWGVGWENGCVDFDVFCRVNLRKAEFWKVLTCTPLTKLANFEKFPENDVFYRFNSCGKFGEKCGKWRVFVKSVFFGVFCAWFENLKGGFVGILQCVDLLSAGFCDVVFRVVLFGASYHMTC